MSSSSDGESANPSLTRLARWRSGDPAALAELLTEFLPWLQAEVHANLGRASGPEDSQDLVQTAIVNFLSSGPRFIPGSEAQFRALLRRIALNEVIDLRRRAACVRAGRLEGGSGSGSQPPAQPYSSFAFQRPSKVAERAEEAEWVRLALQFLSSEERRLLVAAEVEGCPWEDVAQELGLPSADAARVKAARLKPRLANLLRQLRSNRLPTA